MNFFLDPILMIFPPLVTNPIDEQRDRFLDFIETMVDWASLQTDPNHHFFISEKCRNELFNPDATNFPPEYETLLQFWSVYHADEFYALNDVHIACQRLIDIEAMTTIESIVDQSVDPLFNPEKVLAIPASLLERHTLGMRQALEYSLGCMTFFYHEQKSSNRIFRDIRIASDMNLEDVQDLSIKSEVYILHSMEAIPSTKHLEANFPIERSPDHVRLLAHAQDKKLLLLGGHQSLKSEVDDLSQKYSLSFFWIKPEDENRNSETLRQLAHVDGIIIIAFYVGHDVVNDAFKAKMRELKIPHRYMNKGDKLEKILCNLISSLT